MASARFGKSWPKRAELPEHVVEGCFLELVRPDITEVLSSLAAAGIEEVVISPLMLFAARHVREDIPRIASEAAAKCGVSLRFTPALERHRRIVELSAARFQQVLTPDINEQQIAWVLVGRGNRDRQAQADFFEFLSYRRQLTPVGQARGAFLSMAEPRLADILEELAAMPHDWVVVQPHLLFPGELLQRLQRMVEEQDDANQRQRWLLTEPLGSDPRVSHAVVQQFLFAGGGTAGATCQPP